MAFLTLFRIATGDNWNGIMKDALRDDCDVSDHCQTNCCVDPILAPCFFVIFVLISQFVLVNVVVAVLMKHLEESNKRDEAAEANAGLTDTEELKADTDVEDTDGERGELTLANLEKDLIEVEEQLAEETFEIPQKSVECSPNVDDRRYSSAAGSFSRRRLGSSSIYNKDHKVNRTSLSLRSKRDSFKEALTGHRSISPAGRDIFPLATLSSKDEDSNAIDLDSSQELAESKTEL
jgi:hypothetical protein